MALATQCPHCNTTFRVAQDQLKLRAGLVRCGSCKEIFNGIEHLVRPEGTAATSAGHASISPKPAEPTVKVAEETAHATPTPSFPDPVHRHATEPAAIEDISSAGIPISLLAKAPLAKSEPSSIQLDFAYPDPLPESESKPESLPYITPEPEVKPAPESESHATSAPKPEIAKESVAEEELEAHAAEAVEFVDYVEIPREHKEPVFETHEIEEVQPQDPLTRMTLVDLSEDEIPDEPYVEDLAGSTEQQTEPGPEVPDPLDAAIDELKRKPLRGKKKPKPYKRLPTQEAESDSLPDPEEVEAAEHEEPEFVRQSRRKQTIGRTLGIAMGVGSFFLLLIALGQATYTFRDQIAARIPETKPVLVSACLLLDCKVGLPMQIDMMSIESDQLETLNTNKDVSELTMLLRNVAPTAQAWPNLELTLNDTNNTVLSRRVFAPHEYLPGNVDAQKGFASNSEQQVKLDFQFTGSKPAGYHIGVFYP